jgi:hypothetical protein
LSVEIVHPNYSNVFIISIVCVLSVYLS